MSDHLATASAENPPSSQRQWTGLTLIGYSPLAQRKKLANEGNYILNSLGEK
jgi:hypothetical protein